MKSFTQKKNVLFKFKFGLCLLFIKKSCFCFVIVSLSFIIPGLIVTHLERWRYI